MKIGEVIYHTAAHQKELLCIVDDRILEIFFEGGNPMGSFVVDKIGLEIRFNTDALEKIELFEVK